MKIFPQTSKMNRQLSEEEKKQMIRRATKAYAAFMEALEIDYRGDPHTINTPFRVAKAWVNDIAASYYSSPPAITTFDNTRGYEGMVFHGPIPIKSVCSHHHSPFMGEAYVAYIPDKNGKIIGLSKLNRIVEFYSRMPQLQEDITLMVWTSVNQSCKGNRGVICVISATHFCLCSRGVNHHGCQTRTSKLSGDFIENLQIRHEFYSFISAAQNKTMF